MQLSWQRFETHRSPKGHGLRARARGRTVEAWQDDAGAWRARFTDRPQEKPQFRNWAEARQWAEKRAFANPNPAPSAQVVHRRRRNREVATDEGVYDTETWVELVDSETGDIEFSGTLEDLLAEGLIPIPHEDILERMAKRGRIDFRTSLLRELNPRRAMNVVLIAEDGSMEWSGTLDSFLASNEELDPAEVARDLAANGEVHFGGGAAPMVTLRPQGSQMNPSKVDAHKAHRLRVEMDADPGSAEARREADKRAREHLKRHGSISDAEAEKLYGKAVEDAYKRFLNYAGPKMNAETRRYVARELAEDVAWEHAAERRETERGRNPKSKAQQAAEAVARRLLAGDFTDSRDPDLEGHRVTSALRDEASRRGASYDDVAAAYSRLPEVQGFHAARDAVRRWEDGDIGREEIRGRALRIARDRKIDPQAVLDALDQMEIPMTRNPRGKHIACGSRIGAKDCRQLQHVYESAKRRGASDERAAKQAWGSLRRNPQVPLATAKRWLAIRNPVPRRKFEIGDKVLWVGTGKTAIVQHYDPQYDDHIGTYRVKIRFPDGSTKFALEKGLRMKKKSTNPAKGVKGEPDTIAGDELEIWIDNTEPLYRKWQAIVKNLWRHRAKGRYDHERAVDGFMYLVDDGAKHYTKEFGGKWNEIFDAPTRRYVANEYAKSFENNDRDEIEYAPPSAKQNPEGRWGDVTGIEVYDKLNDTVPRRIRADGKAKARFEEYLSQYGARHERYVVQAVDADGEIVVDNQGGKGGGIRHFPKRRSNPATFDGLTSRNQTAALKAYLKGLEHGASGGQPSFSGTLAHFAEAGARDAQVALGGARAGNPTPPQSAWVLIEAGKPVGVFFAERPIDRADALKIANGPGGRRRNGAGLGAFIGSFVGSAIGASMVAVGVIPSAMAGGIMLAPLSALLSMGGGAIGGHVGAPKDRKKRGAIGGGIGGALGPLGAALGGYLGGRKPDKRKRNPAQLASNPNVTFDGPIARRRYEQIKSRKLRPSDAMSDAATGAYMALLFSPPDGQSDAEIFHIDTDGFAYVIPYRDDKEAEFDWEHLVTRFPASNPRRNPKSCGCRHGRERNMARRICA